MSAKVWSRSGRVVHWALLSGEGSRTHCGDSAVELRIARESEEVNCPACLLVARAYDEGFTAAADIVSGCCGCNAFGMDPANPISGESVEDTTPVKPPIVLTAEEVAGRMALFEKRIAVSRALVDEIDTDDGDVEVSEGP